MSTTRGDITRLLESWSGGNPDALEELLPMVYDELRGLAKAYLRRERRGHTLQPTALVHEAFLRFANDSPAIANDRSHFFAVAAQAMRRILVDHARKQRAGKRIGAYDKISLEDSPVLSSSLEIDILALSEALDKLQQINPRQSQLVELRHFGGLTNSEAAEVLGVSLATVERDWQVARLWLRRRLAPSGRG